MDTVKDFLQLALTAAVMYYN